MHSNKLTIIKYDGMAIEIKLWLALKYEVPVHSKDDVLKTGLIVWCQTKSLQQDEKWEQGSLETPVHNWTLKRQRWRKM